MGGALAMNNNFNRAAAPSAPAPAEVPMPERLTEGGMWSFLRSVMSQGIDIRMDYEQGTHAGYEAYSARLDAAAAERAQGLHAEFLAYAALIARAPDLAAEVERLKAEAADNEATMRAAYENACAHRAAVVQELAAERRKVEALRKALNAMLTHMGMDEDEWNKPTFDQARAALAATEGGA